MAKAVRKFRVWQLEGICFSVVVFGEAMLLGPIRPRKDHGSRTAALCRSVTDTALCCRSLKGDSQPKPPASSNQLSYGSHDVVRGLGSDNRGVDNEQKEYHG